MFVYDVYRGGGRARGRGGRTPGNIVIDCVNIIEGGVIAVQYIGVVDVCIIMLVD